MGHPPDAAARDGSLQVDAPRDDPRAAGSRGGEKAAGAAEVEPERSLTLASSGKRGKAAERFRDGRICRDAQGAVH